MFQGLSRDYFQEDFNAETARRNMRYYAEDFSDDEVEKERDVIYTVRVSFKESISGTLLYLDKFGLVVGALKSEASSIHSSSELIGVHYVDML